ncbi:hypothetical protein ACP0HM_11000 [Escherichia coli]
MHQVRDSYHQNLLWIGHQPGIKTRLTALEKSALLSSRWRYRTMSGSPGAGRACRIRRYSCKSARPGNNAASLLARLWLTRATLWILDEPFTAIDVNGVDRLTQRMAQHTEQGDCDSDYPPAAQRC